MTRYQAHDDGSCTWANCPQIRDGESERSARPCPIGCEAEIVVLRFPGFTIQQMQAGLMVPAVFPDPQPPYMGGIFRDHRCWKCNDGERPCVNGHPNRCEYPRARND